MQESTHGCGRGLRPGRKIAVVIGGLSALVAAVGIMWSPDTDWTAGERTARPPEAGGGQVAEHGDVSRSAVAVSENRDQSIDPALAAAVTDESGAICVNVCSVGEEPVSGVRVELCVPDHVRLLNTADEPVVSAPVSTVRESDANGRCVFSFLPPDTKYRLLSHSKDPLFFEAQPSPLSVLQGQDQGKVKLDRTFEMTELSNPRRSGPVPVVANTITRTRLIVARGATIRGLVTGQDWDEATVNLNRLYRGVRSTIVRSRHARFEFSGVVPVGKFDIEFQARRGSSYYFGRSNQLPLADGNSLDVTLEPWDPSSSIELCVRTHESDADPPDVLVKLLREEQPNLLSDIVLKVGQPARVHGMFLARVVSLEMYPARSDWRQPDLVDVVGLREGRLVGPQHAIMLRKRF